MTGETGQSKGGRGTKKPQPRHLSRIGAVQALYQMDLAGTDATDVIQQFSAHRFVSSGDTVEKDQSEDDLRGGDIEFFTDIVSGVVRQQREIDPLVDQQLATGWRLVRVDSILRAILRAGTYELLERADVPSGVIINEYINVGHCFFFGDEPGVINGVLDALAAKIRGDGQNGSKDVSVG